MSVSYVLKEGFAGFRRARLSAFSSVFAIMLAVMLLAILARVGYNAYNLAQSIRQDVEVEVFLHDISEDRTASLRNSIESHTIVTNLQYISKEDAMERFRAEFGPGSEVLGSVNFLPASFKINVDTDAPVPEIVAFVEEVSGYVGVDEVKFNRMGLELLEERLNMFLLWGGLLGFLIAITAMSLVFNTIRLTIYAKRNLIKAMKLVGATNGFIKRPFMVEGVLHGLVAAMLALGLVWLIFHFLIPLYLPQVGIIAWPFGRWYFLTGAMIVFAIIMGFLGSRWAAQKFIRRASAGG